MYWRAPNGELLATQPRLMESLRDISSHVLGGGIPQLGSTAALGGSVAVTVARAILTGRELPSGRTVIDPERLLNLPLQRSIYAGQVAVAN